MRVPHQARNAIPPRLRIHLYELASRRRKRRWADAPGSMTLDDASGVALTFDDGPDPDGTRLVLDALDASSASGTFFLVGDDVRAHSALAREIVQRGHDVGVHCMTHRRLDQLDPAEARRDVVEAVECIREEIGVEPRWFRPPFGRGSDVLVSACKELALHTVYWSTWGVDWERVSSARVARRVIRDLRPGGIVLLHDSPAYGARQDAGTTADAIPAIVQAVHERGLQLKTLSEAIVA